MTSTCILPSRAWTLRSSLPKLDASADGAASVVADIDQQFFAVAVPLCPDSANLGLVQHGQQQAPHNGSGCVGDFPRKRPSVQGRLDELHFHPAETRQRKKVLAEALERPGYRLFDQVRGPVAKSAQPHEGFGLADLADSLVVVPAAQKTDHGSGVTCQYSGSLFEQVLFVLTESIFQTLWNHTDAPAEELWLRHANLE
jgi:hypothetical protein